MAFKKFIFLCFLSLFCASFSPTLKAQSKIKPATIILKNGQQKKGFIHTPARKLTGQHILFSESKSGSKTKYSPKELESFVVVDRVFKSATMKIDVTSVGTEVVRYKDTVLYETQTFFMEEIASGSLSLYEYIGSDNKRHYILKDANGGLLELSYQSQRVLFYEELRRFPEPNIIEKTGYRDELYEVMSECSNVGDVINKAGYNRGDLSKVFERYYECNGEFSAVIRKQGVSGFQLDLFTGLQTTSLSYDARLVGGQFPSHNSPVFGIAGSYFPGGRLTNISFFLEGLFEIFEAQQSSSFAISPVLRYDFDTDVFMQLVRVQVGTRFQLSPNKLKPYAQVGLGMGSLINYKATSTNLTFGENEFNVEERFTGITHRNVFLGVGANMTDRLGLSLRYNRSSMDMPEFSPGSKANTYSLMVRYRILNTAKR